MEFEQVLTAVGPRLRALRQQQERTLAELAESTGISLSTLSRLESGQRKPTLELLLPLAAAYGVQLDELVGAPQTGDPRVHMKPFVRHGVTMIPLTRHLGGLQAVKIILPPSTRGDEPREQRTHEGNDWFYVLSGKVRLWLGEHDLVLGPGEAAEFDTRVPHAFDSDSPEGAEVLAIFGPQGERVHLRARPSGAR